MIRGPFLSVVLCTAFGLSAPAGAQERPDHYILGTDRSSGWKAESRLLVQWEDGKPIKEGLACKASHVRNMQDGKPPFEISIFHPVESGEYRFRFHYNLPDNELIDRSVETITIGGRPYQRQIVQSRLVGFTRPGDIILTYGIGREMYRANEEYPWLPIEFLVPQFFEVEGIKLGISGEFEIEHGEYEKRYEEIDIRMDGFKEIWSWCFEQVNPTDDDGVELPAELIETLSQ